MVPPPTGVPPDYSYAGLGSARQATVMPGFSHLTYVKVENPPYVDNVPGGKPILFYIYVCPKMGVPQNPWVSILKWPNFGLFGVPKDVWWFYQCLRNRVCLKKWDTSPNFWHLSHFLNGDFRWFYDDESGVSFPYLLDNPDPFSKRPRADVGPGRASSESEVFQRCRRRSTPGWRPTGSGPTVKIICVFGTKWDVLWVLWGWKLKPFQLWGYIMFSHDFCISETKFKRRPKSNSRRLKSSKTGLIHPIYPLGDRCSCRTHLQQLLQNCRPHWHFQGKDLVEFPGFSQRTKDSSDSRPVEK